jgi:hypothetical protein
MGHHNGEPGATHHHKSGVQHTNSYPKGSLKSTDNIEGGEGWSTYEPPEYRHHTGKHVARVLECLMFLFCLLKHS